MKKFWILAFILVGCASPNISPVHKKLSVVIPPKSIETRKPTSESFICNINADLNGKEYNFKFNPEEHQLLVNSPKESDQIAMMESDFSEGGYVYKNATKGLQWDIQVVLTSYKNNPHLKLAIYKSPFSSENLVIEKVCQKSAE